MSKRTTGRHHGSNAGQEYEERRQYMRLHAAGMDLETLATGFFSKFDLKNRSSASDALHSSLMATGNEHLANKIKDSEFKQWMADYFAAKKKTKKMGVQSIIDQQLVNLQASGVRKGSKVIRSGMDLLVPEDNSGMADNDYGIHEETAMPPFVPHDDLVSSSVTHVVGQDSACSMYTTRATGEKHPRQSSDDESTDLPKNARHGFPSATDADDDDEAEDSNVMEEVIQELREVEKDVEPGFHPLIRALYHVVRGENFQKPSPKPVLSAQQSFLWDFVHSRLDVFGTMTPSEQKDVFVAMSGIVDLEVQTSFPGRDELLRLCRAEVSFSFPAVREQIESYQVYVDVEDGVEEARPDDLKRRLRADMAHFEEGSTHMMVAEILMILVKRCVPDKFGRAKRTESSALFVWYAVWEVLFAATAVEVEVGETILREAQKDQVAVRVVVGSKAAVGRAGASGRKLDFRLIATIKTGQRFEAFTLSNDEHKGLGSSDLVADIQRKKNMRLNKSIVVNGRVPMITGNLYQDVVGLDGTWNIICPFEDVMLCCETEQPSLRLPSNEFELGFFLLGDGMERFLAFREHILSLARKVQGLVSNPRRPSTSRRAQVPVPSPSISVHAPTPLQSGLRTPINTQPPVNRLANTPVFAEGHDGNSAGITTPQSGAAAHVPDSAEWTHASLQPRPSTPPRASSLQTHPPTFYTPTKPK